MHHMTFCDLNFKLLFGGPTQLWQNPLVAYFTCLGKHTFFCFYVIIHVLFIYIQYIVYHFY